MKKVVLFFLVIMSLVVLNANAQQQLVVPDKAICGDNIELKGGDLFGPFTTECSGSIQAQSNNPKWAMRIRSTFYKNHCLPEVEQIKKQKNIDKFNFKPNSGSVEPDNTKSVLPYVNTQFEANWSQVGTPPDNSVAISNGGIIVSVNNDEIGYGNSTGAFTWAFWDAFFNDPLLTSIIYDPKVIYDSGADRFILVILHGSSSTTSKVIVCFSKTNDPAGGWWVYKLNGNPLSNSCWVDYPNIGVSTNDLFITGNLFDDSYNFNSAVVYQMTKSTGYSGGSLSWGYYSNLNSNPFVAFSLVPMSNGQQSTYGPGIYMVSNSAGGASAVRLWHVTNDLGSSPTMTNNNITTTTYSPGGDAQQLGNSDFLSTNDCRIMNGFYLDGIIHFVFHADAGSGWCGIVYSRINVSGLTISSTTNASVGNYDHTFPSVASFATSSTDKSVMIGFLRSSSAIYPQVRVINCDDAMSWSASTEVKLGETYIDYMTGTERWGDYSGMSRKHNNLSATVWMAGCYGALLGGNNFYKTRVAEITAGPTVGLTEVPASDKIRVYPNPGYDFIYIDFELPKNEQITIQVFNNQGQVVKLLYQDVPKPGSNQLIFNRQALNAGIYFVVFSTAKGVFKNEKLIISD